jgi:hypothetical protein
MIALFLSLEDVLESAISLGDMPFQQRGWQLVECELRSRLVQSERNQEASQTYL